MNNLGRKCAGVSLLYAWWDMHVVLLRCCTGKQCHLETRCYFENAKALAQCQQRCIGGITLFTPRLSFLNSYDESNTASLADTSL